MAQTSSLAQVSVESGPNGSDLLTDSGVNAQREEDEYQQALLELCPKHLWYNGSYTAGCPRPILVDQKHLEAIEDLHDALKNAIWIDDQARAGKMLDFANCLGSWRPDFLVEDGEEADEIFRITEINARFSFNGFVHEAYGQEVINRSVNAVGSDWVGATDHKTILNGLFGLFDPSRPLYLLKGTEPGIDIHMFADALWSRYGIGPRIIRPEDLRMLATDDSKIGRRLYCDAKELIPDVQAPRIKAENGEVWEEIRQVGLELHQKELASLDPEMLHQVALRCFNDMRTILLVHDKRMLGIIREEVPRLMERRVLTPKQGAVLNKGIVETIIPGSQAMHDLIRDSATAPHLRHGYILKPIRSGKGDGIVFGDDIGNEEWVSRLRDLASPRLVAGVSCVVQRRIVPREYDLLLKASVGAVKYPLVGTYHVTDGKLLGLGMDNSLGTTTEWR
ncbi:hypothetical protein C8035_v007565 [Colletotrichum spinosum]|uniref:Glutathione synthetase ATP-binding domain-like protein n=1 Tax=Colletotrichum spinosum TaxID=1347390 RepID=A0A4V3HQN5_9PEZI|nr:hypothetical protein C8035_v007565 [Colletotrichum spinosum]